MLKIGEFSALTGISIYMLRNYDQIGLLKPEQVDPFTGYRYYGERQVVEANLIQVLKSLGFGLKEIHSIQSKDIFSDQVKAFLRNKIKEKKSSVFEMEQQINQLEKAVAELDSQNDFSLSVHVKKLPARKIVSLRGVIHEFNEEGLLWARLAAACKEHGVVFADVPYCYSAANAVDFENRRIDAEVWRVVEKAMPDVGELSFSEIPETLVAAVAYQGSYSRIGEINRFIYRWITENGYKLHERAFNTYYISPDTEPNPENFVTEICFPIKK